MFRKTMDYGNQAETPESIQLDRLLRAYREASPDPEASADFMPQLWAKIEARESSSNWFQNVARTLVTAALAASVILGLISFASQPNTTYNGTYLEALMADHASNLEPLSLDRISELEQQ